MKFSDGIKYINDVHNSNKNPAYKKYPFILFIKFICWEDLPPEIIKWADISWGEYWNE